MKANKGTKQEMKIWLGIAFMFVMAVVLGLRSQGTVSSMTSILNATAAPAAAAHIDQTPLASLAARDSFIRHVPPGDLNPFAQTEGRGAETA